MAGLLARAQSADCVEALLYLIANSGGLRGYTSTSSAAGAKKHFGYWRDGRNDFAFIVNSDWLLFYFRRPFLDRVGNERWVLDTFPEARRNPKGELAVKITALQGAKTMQVALQQVC